MPVNKNYKQGRVNEEVKRVLSTVIREIKDPRIPQMVSIMHVDVSSDLKYAKVFVSFFGEYDEADVKRGLKAANKFIRKRLADNLDMRIVPELTFVIDHSLQTGDRIENIIKEIHSGEEK